jgi:hypothetical protein
VPLKSKDEIGELASAFNLMAAQVEQHQHDIVEQERLKRELELGRQIQHEMLPSAPLTMGLTQIEGVSVPAREVGGDFFNYFALPNGDVAFTGFQVFNRPVGSGSRAAAHGPVRGERVTSPRNRCSRSNSPGRCATCSSAFSIPRVASSLRERRPQSAIRAGAKGTSNV